MALLTLTLLSVLLLVPVSNGDTNIRILRLIANTNGLITQLQENSESHKRDLNDLFVQKIEELKGLILQHETSLNALPSEIVSNMREEHDIDDSDGECPLKQAMLSLLQDNPNNVTEELATRLSSETACPDDATSSSDEGNNCYPVPVNPEDTVGMFKIRARARGVCTNNDPVLGLNNCKGGCPSRSEYIDGGRRMRIVTTCSCCQPARFEKIPVAMVCNNGYNFTKNFDNIAECRCLKCDGGKDEEIV